MELLSGGEMVVQALEDEGVEYVFGYPGGAVLHIYDALFKQAETEVDPEKRRSLFIQMNDLLVEDVALIPLVHTADPVGMSTSLDGLQITNWDSTTWNIKDWRRK